MEDSDFPPIFRYTYKDTSRVNTGLLWIILPQAWWGNTCRHQPACCPKLLSDSKDKLQLASTVTHQSPHSQRIPIMEDSERSVSNPNTMTRRSFLHLLLLLSFFSFFSYFYLILFISFLFFNWISLSSSSNFCLFSFSSF